MEPRQRSVDESQFNMWRTLFAMTHADDVVTDEEVRFMMEALEDLPFSKEQRDVLEDDIYNPKDIVEMFRKIDNPTRQAEFFKFARTLVWIDGDYGEEEQEIMLKLKQEHIQNVNIDNLIGKVDIELEDANAENFQDNTDGSDQKRDIKSTIFSFRKAFMRDLNRKK